MASLANRKITMFTWGYWGWGNQTQKFIQAVDSIENARGFTPPFFVDIRISRSVRAKGFNTDAFHRTLGNRYEWMPGLGNLKILSGSKSEVQIKNPEEADTLLSIAINKANNNQRIIFFCACEFPKLEGNPESCHRTTVAHLVLAKAKKKLLPIEIVEWPGGTPQTINMTVTDKMLKEIKHGKKTIAIGNPALLGKSAAIPWGIPWGSVAILSTQSAQVQVVTGPAKYKKGAWVLPIIPIAPSGAAQWCHDFGLEARTK